MIKLRTTGTTTITSGAIAASGSFTSEAYDVTQLQGYFSLQWAITGTGTMTAEVLVSNDGVTFFDLDTDIATGKTVGSGMVGFSATPCNYLKIRLTETAGGGSTLSVVAQLRAS